MASPQNRKKLGLIINPIAGIGGRVGLKGSDGEEIQRRALSEGAVPLAQERACKALEELKSLRDFIELITYPAEMGEAAAHSSGFEPRVIGTITSGHTCAADTTQAAKDLHNNNVDLLLFAGGDGTARDIFTAIDGLLPTLGIPAGVKIHSAVYATSPANAGRLAASFLKEETLSLIEAEVMDTDEDAFRQGQLSARLFGYLKIPAERRYLQGQKSASLHSEAASLEAIAWDVIDHMEDDVLYIIGPGTTTRAITTLLGLDKTLLGVDVIKNRHLLAVDVNEVELLKLLEKDKARIIITPIGGQGFLFGRGNQQISPAVIRKVGKSNIIVVSTVDKIRALNRKPLLVDTGEREVDEMLEGYLRVITGYGERLVYRIE